MTDHPLAKYLTLPQARERLEVGHRTVERMIDDGRIAAIKHGGKVLISEEEIADYFRRLEVNGAKRRAARAKKNPQSTTQAAKKNPKPTTQAGRRDSLSGVGAAAG